MGEWADKGRQLMVKRGATVLADDTGKVLHQLSAPVAQGADYKNASTQGRSSATACVAPRHGQDVVVDPAGNAFSVRVHLAQHLHLNERVAKLEDTVADLQGQVNTYRKHMHDLRRENFVTQGAFMAALLCKADKGVVKYQRGKLDFLCKLLISAGVFTEGTSGVLCARQQGENTAPYAVQSVDAGITDYLDERLAHAGETIANLERTVEAASMEAKRTAAVATEACERLEEVATQCGRADERCTRVDERCRQLEEWCAAAVEQGTHRVEERVEESAGRIETNTTRIVHLASEVEGLAMLLKESAASAKSRTTAQEKTGDIFSFENADLPQEGRRRAVADAPASPKTTAGEGKEKHDKLMSGTRRAQKAPGETRKLNTPAEEENSRVPGRPGVLDEPEVFPQAGRRAGTDLLAASLQQPAPPSARSCYRSPYTGRRVTLPLEIKGAPASPFVSPVRPLEERPTADTSRWSRASSWPLLPNEEAAHRLHDAGAGDDTATCAERNVHLNKVTGDVVRPVIDLFPCIAGGDGSLCRHSAAIGDHCDDSDSPLDARQRSDSPTRRVGDVRWVEDEDSQTPASSQLLARMTANEVVEALSTAALARGRSRHTAMEATLSLDSLLGRVSSPGARLACLGNPLLDLGGNEAPSSDGSITTATSGHGEDQVDL